MCTLLSKASHLSLHACLMRSNEQSGHIDVRQSCD